MLVEYPTLAAEEYSSEDPCVHARVHITIPILDDMKVIRLWKGYRSASCGWLHALEQVPVKKMDDKSRTRSTGTGGAVFCTLTVGVVVDSKASSGGKKP